MHLTYLRLDNFAIHDFIELNFTKGVNALIGDTDAGKSTILRALRLGTINEPRGGEKLYQSWSTDKALRIEIHDDQGNVLVRTGRKYYINGGDPIEAFNADVPQAVFDLFPFKDVNIQRQIDPYFLILDTGGKAAQVINKAAGLEDQELLIDEIKKRMSLVKANIKFQHKTKENAESKIKELIAVPELLSQADEVTKLQLEHDDIVLSSTNLQQLIIRRKEVMTMLVMANKFIPITEGIKEIRTLTNPLNQVELKLDRLQYFLTKRKEHTLKILQYSFLQGTQSLLLELKSLHADFSEFDQAIKLKMEPMLNNRKEKEQKYFTTDMEIDELKLKKDTMLKQLGVCPLCNSVIK